jgi:3-methyladenine DNA glycosylase/8-oxoguanine DNA glycosylase
MVVELVRVETTYSPAHPVNLKQTMSPLLRGTMDPTHRWEGAAFWRTVNTSAGAATLHLVERGGEIHATAWGFVGGADAEGTSAAEIAIAGVPELCGAGDDWTGLDLAAHPFLAETRRRSPGLLLCRTNAVFEALIAAILEQKVTGIEARRAWRYLLAKYGTEPPGPAPQGMRVLPDAAVWRRIPSWEWHKAGVGPQQSETAVRAAGVAESLERTLVADTVADGAAGTISGTASGTVSGTATAVVPVASRGGATVAAKLRSLRGIGVWTAAETQQRSHGDPDSPSVGDYHLPAIVGYAFRGEPVDDDGMLELLEPYAGHRHPVVRLILQSGVTKPKFGPRMQIRDHRSY